MAESAVEEHDSAAGDDGSAARNGLAAGDALESDPEVDSEVVVDSETGVEASESVSSEAEVVLTPQSTSSDAPSELLDGFGPGNTLSDGEIESAVAALVYASPDPISERRLQNLLEGPEIERVRSALAKLRERLAASGLPYELRTLAGGVQILTTPDVGEIVQRLAKVRKSERISGAALETLAVVAYRQPVSKAEIEAIRGVQAGPILRTLIERGLVRVTGRADLPGHPLQYGTTRDFLDRFGLGSLDDLPRDGELAKD